MNTKELLGQLMLHVPVANIVQNAELTDLWQACNEAIEANEEPFEFELHVNNEFQVCCAGNSSWEEILRYVPQYQQDGQVEIYRITREKVKLP